MPENCAVVGRPQQAKNSRNTATWFWRKRKTLLKSWPAIIGSVTIAVGLVLVPQTAEAATIAVDVTLKAAGSGGFLALNASSETIQSSVGTHWNITPVAGANQYSRLERTGGKCLDARSR